MIPEGNLRTGKVSFVRFLCQTKAPIWTNRQFVMCVNVVKHGSGPLINLRCHFPTRIANLHGGANVPSPQLVDRLRGSLVRPAQTGTLPPRKNPPSFRQLIRPAQARTLHSLEGQMKRFKQVN